MLDRVQKYIPIITSEAGLCLTAANWQEAQINNISFHLDALLLKPGYELLKKIPDLAQYMGWSGGMILNATKCVANKEGIFTLTSPYDGSKLKLTNDQLVGLIQHIKPDAVLLPSKITKVFPRLWDSWNDSIMPFIASEDLLNEDLNRIHGVYFNLNNSISNNMVTDELKRWAHLPGYVISHDHLESINDLKKEGIIWIESDEPAVLARQGIVLTQKGRLQLSANIHAMQFDIIENHCSCPTCSQKLTKAYLHHLYLHTPLLCQRFLIQHNVYYVQNSIRN